ncbi:MULTISPECIES: hypothetical protein [unclassified Leptolyngbya]|uniref:hypothetical protein n=1 Tax=unclassified Leptolyngbya TaxID=2650499 RepID=UPI00168842E2|nr:MULTISPECIES: hypothetical protein [unclassified Leptolyngbya]MBD1913778.1 hypothetical protein [Leptolyngbya sp. FACHB-8]MBD2156138.1 hypothetical protein [Leptolyngbya sp. FACHB-16]
MTQTYSGSTASPSRFSIMDLAYLRKYITTEVSQFQRYLWLGLSLLISLSYSLPVMLRALSSRFIIQDDARQHVSWMRRFLDPDIYPNDLMADYFQSVAPWGYSTFYHLFSQVGVDPIVLSKLLPPILALVTTVYIFLGTMQFLPSPVAAFISATLMNQNLWLRDDIVSATPVAFVYPFFTAFFYYLMRRSLIPFLISLVLLGLFYPQVMLIASGVLCLRLFSFKNGRLGFAPSSDLRFYLMGLGTVFLLLIPYAVESSPYGPVLSRAEALNMTAMGRNGWSRFFESYFSRYWICGKRSGFLPSEWCDLSFSLPQIGLGFLLPLLILERQRFPLAKRVSPESLVVPQTLVASFGLFLLAHMLLFRMHLPNRYGEHSLRIIMALSAGVTLVILGDRLLSWIQSQAKPSLKIRSFGALSLTALLVTILLANPYQLTFERERFPIARYEKGLYPEIYEFLLSKPKDTLIASIDNEVNNIPSFAERPVYVGGGGYVLPYHKGYFQEAQTRLLDVLNTQYSNNLNQIKKMIRRTGIDYWLIDRDFATVDYLQNEVFAQFPEFRKPLKERILKGYRPALAVISKKCVVAESASSKHVLQLLNTTCLLKQSAPKPGKPPRATP